MQVLFVAAPKIFVMVPSPPEPLRQSPDTRLSVARSSGGEGQVRGDLGDASAPHSRTPLTILGDVAVPEWLAGPRRVLRVFPSRTLTKSPRRDPASHSGRSTDSLSREYNGVGEVSLAKPLRRPLTLSLSPPVRPPVPVRRSTTYAERAGRGDNSHERFTNRDVPDALVNSAASDHLVPLGSRDLLSGGSRSTAICLQFRPSIEVRQTLSRGPPWTPA